ncbi:MAG: putative transcriptional regulator [Frankiales bacterium]|jgi:putative transcriptional regulator|nr:putative transcriptional regulator [Frankiales bacterium]
MTDPGPAVNPTDPAGSTEPAPGRLLVATPRLADPNFRRTVILLLDHSDDGVLGVVLNRPSEAEVADALPEWADHATDPVRVFVGGPVQPSAALGLAWCPPGLPDDDDGGLRVLNGSLGTLDLEEPYAVPAGCRGVRIFAGYAGWGTEQLREEIAEGSWYVVDALPEDAVTPEPDTLWRRVLRRQPGPLALMASYPQDPSLN